MSLRGAGAYSAAWAQVQRQGLHRLLLRRGLGFAGAWFIGLCMGITLRRVSKGRRSRVMVVGQVPVVSRTRTEKMSR